MFPAILSAYFIVKNFLRSPVRSLTPLHIGQRFMDGKLIAGTFLFKNQMEVVILYYLL